MTRKYDDDHFCGDFGSHKKYRLRLWLTYSKFFLTPDLNQRSEVREINNDYATIRLHRTDNTILTAEILNPASSIAIRISPINPDLTA